MAMLPEFLAKFRRSNPIPPEDLRCIETIAPKEKENWVVNIGTKKYNLDYLHKLPMWDDRKKFRITDGTFILDKPSALSDVEYLTLYESVNANPLDNFELLQQRCVENSKILYGLAKNLSGCSVNKICMHIFTQNGVTNEFVIIFYRYFFRMYFRRPYNWFSVSLLIRARVAYPEKFDKLVEALIKDVEVPNGLLIDYAATLNIEKQTEMLNIITKRNLNNVEFCHSLKLICFLFKNCDKNVGIYDYVLTHLEIHAIFCSANKDYGRLLLTFMNNLSDFQALHLRRFPARRLIDIHGTVFKASCILILDDIVSAMLDLHHDDDIFISRHRFFIPREPAPSFL